LASSSAPATDPHKPDASTAEPVVAPEDLPTAQPIAPVQSSRTPVVAGKDLPTAQPLAPKPDAGKRKEPAGGVDWKAQRR
jgi:hypothetical protein